MSLSLRGDFLSERKSRAPGQEGERQSLAEVEKEEQAGEGPALLHGDPLYSLPTACGSASPGPRWLPVSP